VRTEWTNGANTDNGAYGIYPVQSENILIEGSVAIGASDAGIYVGQSKNIVVRDSRAEYNVAGIEIENSTHADVYRNVATKNTGGILVFDLPNLPVQGGQATRVFNNDIYSNDTENFAPEGNIVGNVPTGTGLLILANDNIEVFENRFADNGNVNIMIYSFLFGGRQIDDTKYDPYPEKIYIYNNDFDGGGDRPRHPALIAWTESSALGTPDVVWDGMVRRGNGQESIICLGKNATENLLNLGGAIDAASSRLALDSHRCSFDLLDPIEL
jgi:parallel beta-helix repeat protein